MAARSPIKKQLILAKTTIEYSLRLNRRARGIRLAVHHDGRVVATIPPRISQELVEQIIAEKSDWIIQNLERFKHIPRTVLIENTKRNFDAHKARALALAQERIEYFNSRYGFRFTKLTIRNQRTRWGSCSKYGSLTFNYRIALLPARICDYIIVHELCHTAQLNHSKAFWDLVARTTPDHKAIRKELKKYSMGSHIR